MSPPIRTREQLIVEMADELMLSGRFEDYVKASVWATRIYEKCFPSSAGMLMGFDKELGQALDDSTVYGVEPKSLHKIFLQFEMVRLIKAFFKNGHV